MQVYVRLGIRLLYKVSNMPLSPWHSVTTETFFFLSGRSLEVGGHARCDTYFFLVSYMNHHHSSRASQLPHIQTGHQV
jgi:hypothetical protein